MNVIEGQVNKLNALEPSAHAAKPANALLNKIIENHSLKNDAALARFLQLAPPVISKMRYGKLAVSGDTMIRVHEITGMTIKAIKDVLGLKAAMPR